MLRLTLRRFRGAGRPPLGVFRTRPFGQRSIVLDVFPHLRARADLRRHEAINKPLLSVDYDTVDADYDTASRLESAASLVLAACRLADDAHRREVVFV